MTGVTSAVLLFAEALKNRPLSDTQRFFFSECSDTKQLKVGRFFHFFLELYSQEDKKLHILKALDGHLDILALQVAVLAL